MRRLLGPRAADAAPLGAAAFSRPARACRADSALRSMRARSLSARICSLLSGLPCSSTVGTGVRAAAATPPPPPPPPPPAGDATTAVASAATAEGPPPHEPPPPPASRGAALAACDGFSPNQLKQLTAWREAARKFLFPSLYQRRAPPPQISCGDARKRAEAGGESADGSASAGTSSDEETESDESDGESLLVLCNK